jgi:hypothetical protein
LPNKANAMDAQLILHLYELRREPEMRKARNWWLTEFWPRTAEDFMKVGSAMGTPENNWLRQVSSYWSMAASFALNGALNADLFLQPAMSGEMVFLLAKVYPFLEELREKMEDPQIFGNIEKLVTSSKYGRERLKLTLKRVEMMREKRIAAKAS